MSKSQARILTEEELKEIEDLYKRLFPRLNTEFPNVVKLIASHRELLAANAELSFENMKLKELIFKLDAHMDFNFPPASGELIEFKDAAGIAQMFKEAYRIVNPDQAAINEALEELK